MSSTHLQVLLRKLEPAMAVGCRSSTLLVSTSMQMALHWTSVPCIIQSFLLPWLEKHPELSKHLLHLRQLPVTKQEPVMRSQDHLLEEFQSTGCYQKHLRSHYALHMLFLTDLRQDQPNKSIFALHHSFFLNLSLKKKTLLSAVMVLGSRTSQSRVKK